VALTNLLKMYLLIGLILLIPDYFGYYHHLCQIAELRLCKELTIADTIAVLVAPASQRESDYDALQPSKVFMDSG
jgi:hypothetical protein